jgi:hypothetical protein
MSASPQPFTRPAPKKPPGDAVLLHHHLPFPPESDNGGPAIDVE